MLIAFHKPYGVLSQFNPDGSPNRTLAGYQIPSRLYPLGRLDADSEGLLLLSDEPGLNSKLLDPSRGHLRTYWVQVEGIPDEADLETLRTGVLIQGRNTLPCRANAMTPPNIPPRNPPIRFRKNVADSWIELELSEGKNRQVRRMTAAVGHPTLRLYRARIGRYELGNLPPGRWVTLGPDERAQVFSLPHNKSIA